MKHIPPYLHRFWPFFMALFCPSLYGMQKDSTKESIGLLAAIIAGDEYAVRQRLSDGADANAVITNNGNNTSALYHAVQGRRLNIVRLLLEKKADPNAHDAQGVTPLMLAAQPIATTTRSLHALRRLTTEQPLIIGALLEHGAKPDLQDDEGNQAADYAPVATNKQLFEAKTEQK